MQLALQKSSHKALAFFLFFSLTVSGFLFADTSTEETEQVEPFLQDEDPLAAILRAELTGLSSEKLVILAQQMGINPQGMNDEQIKDVVIHQLLASMQAHRYSQAKGALGDSEVQKKSYKKEFFGLLLAAMMRRIGYLMAENPDSKIVSTLLTLPLRYTFPFLMAGKDEGTKMFEQLINQEDNQLTENQKKLFKYLARMPQTFIGNGVDLEGKWLAEECGYFLGVLGEVSLIQLLPAFIYRKCCGKNTYTDGKMDQAVVDSAVIINELLRVEARQLITSLMGKKNIEKIQNNTFDILNPELADVGISSTMHSLLQAYGYEGDKEKAADYFRRELKLHCATGVGSTLLLSKHGDVFTKGIGKAGDKVGNFLVWLGLTDKKTLQTMVKGSKFLMQRFVGPLFMNNSPKLAAIHQMMQTGNLAGFEKDKSTTRSVSRFVVKNIAEALMNEYKNYQKNEYSPLSRAWTCTKISALLSAWYLYRSEGAGTLEELLMGDIEWQEKEMAWSQDPKMRMLREGRMANSDRDVDQSELDPKFA